MILLSVLLACWAIRLRRIRYLDIDATGVTVHTTWRNRRIDWEEMERIELSSRNLGVMWGKECAPAIVLDHQRSCILWGFIERSSTPDWAEETLRTLLHARMHHAHQRDASSSPTDRRG